MSFIVVILLFKVCQNLSGTHLVEFININIHARVTGHVRLVYIHYIQGIDKVKFTVIYNHYIGMS